MENRQVLINFKLFVGPDSAYVISRGSLIAMFKIKEAALGSVARRGSNDQLPIYRSLP